MPPPRPISPAAALGALVTHLVRPPVEAVEVDDARGLWLAETPEWPGAELVRVAAWDGFALPARPEPGARLDVTPRTTESIAPPAPPGVRVDSGDRLAAEVAWVLPVAAITYVADRCVHVDHVPSGDGIELLDRASGEAPVAPPGRGIRVGARLQAALIARGVPRVLARRRPRVAVLSIGGELAPVEAASTFESGARPDVASRWIAAELGERGFPVRRLGIVDDDPAALRGALLPLRSRGDRLVVTIGGVGSGITDRVHEALSKIGSRILFSRIAFEGAENALYAKTLGLDVIALSGRPIATRVGWRLLVRPALDAVLGARPDAWDWRRRVGRRAASADGVWRFELARRGDPCSGVPHPTTWEPGVDGFLLYAPDASGPVFVRE